MKNHIFFICLTSSRWQNTCIWLDLSIRSMLELLVLKKYAECISQHRKWTSGARVMIIFGRSVARSLSHLVTQSLGRLDARSLGRSIARSLGRSVARSLDRSVVRSLGRSVWITWPSLAWFYLLPGLVSNYPAQFGLLPSPARPGTSMVLAQRDGRRARLVGNCIIVRIGTKAVNEGLRVMGRRSSPNVQCVEASVQVEE